MNIKKKVNYITFIALFIVCFLDSTFIFANAKNGIYVLLLDLAAMLILFFITKNKNINKKNLLILVCSLCVVIISGLIVGNFKQTTIVSLMLIVSFTVTNLIEFENFKEKFLKIMFFLAVSSLICFAISLLFPNLILKFPIVKSFEQYNFDYHNLFVSIVSTNSYLNRNYGIFWEPGAYSIFLNIALLLELSSDSPKLNRILFFVLSILTTFSTLGIICCALLIIYFFSLKKSDNVFSKKIKYMLIIIGAIVIIYLFLDGEYFLKHVFGKLKKNTLNTYSVSTITRYTAVVVPILNFLRNPLFGIGFENYLIMQARDCFNMATCTFVNWICIYGILGFFPIKYCISFFLSFSKNIVSKILMFIFALLLFSTENFLQITFIYIIMFYGLNKIDKKVVKK